MIAWRISDCVSSELNKGLVINYVEEGGYKMGESWSAKAG